MLTSALVVVFLGGVIVESGPNLASIPGPYIVVADSRSVEPQGIAAATWGLTYLGPNKRVATDRINQMLMNTYGDQRVVTYLNDKVDVSPIFYSEQFDNSDLAILRSGQIQYLVVDLRLSTALPLEGTYFEIDQPTQPTQIIRRDALTKFNTVTQMNRLFDSGNIAIYDAEAFLQ
jgi:hypothetical protein